MVANVEKLTLKDLRIEEDILSLDINELVKLGKRVRIG
jgi:hypothetical protein